MRKDENWLVHDHTLYENYLSQCKDAAEVEDWKAVNLAFRELAQGLKQHVALEEEVLYPSYEQIPGAPPEPTAALREEHDQMLNIIGNTLRFIKDQDSRQVSRCLSSLENHMVKHHEKEEDIFLPMASRFLEAERDELIRKLNAFESRKASDS